MYHLHDKDIWLFNKTVNHLSHINAVGLDEYYNSFLRYDRGGNYMVL